MRAPLSPCKLRVPPWSQLTCLLRVGAPLPAFCSLLLAVYGAQCALADGKPVFGCCTSPYTGGAFKCEDGKGAPDTETMER